MKNFVSVSDFNIAEKMNQSIDRLMEKAEEAVQETVIELYGEAVSKTPIKEGGTISSWEAKVDNVPVSTSDYYYSRAVDSRGTAREIGRRFKSEIRPAILGQPLGTEYRLENSNIHVLMLENGRYKQPPREYKEKIPPYYMQNPPFSLTAGGYSKKAPYGMVKITLIQSGNIWNKMFRRYSS
jgi:hypothetical protein